jgi:hypothetical protein
MDGWISTKDRRERTFAGEVKICVAAKRFGGALDLTREREPAQGVAGLSSHTVTDWRKATGCAGGIKA